MSNVNKPVIPAEVAEAIELLRDHSVRRPIPVWSDELILRTVLVTKDPGPTVEALQSIPFDTLLAALVNGYERELSEEERRESAIKREWLDRDRRRHNSEYCDGFADGIEFVLGELSVEIEGVNA